MLLFADPVDMYLSPYPGKTTRLSTMGLIINLMYNSDNNKNGKQIIRS